MLVRGMHWARLCPASSSEWLKTCSQQSLPFSSGEFCHQWDHLPALDETFRAELPRILEIARSGLAETHERARR